MSNSTSLVKVTETELSKIRDLQTSLNQAKQAFGAIEIERHRLYRSLDMLQMEMAKNENDLIAKYGQNAVINTQTGEVTQKSGDNVN